MTTKSIMYDLYHGRISPQERKATQSDERSEVNRKIENETRYFMEKMSLDDCRRFQALENLYAQTNDFEQLDTFSYGFKLAAMLMCAVFTDDHEPT